MHRHARWLTGLLCACLVGGCGGTGPDDGARSQGAAQTEATASLGDTVLRANAMPSMALAEAVAAQYGIDRKPGSVMLLVSLRDSKVDAALRAGVTATATDLLGKRQTIGMREIRNGEFVDYVGSASVIAPDTLRFDIEAMPEGKPAMTLRFNRDFFP